MIYWNLYNFNFRSHTHDLVALRETDLNCTFRLSYIPQIYPLTDMQLHSIFFIKLIEFHSLSPWFELNLNSRNQSISNGAHRGEATDYRLPIPPSQLDVCPIGRPTSKPLEASPSWLDPWGNFGSPNSTATLMMEKSQTSMVDPIGMANLETEILPETFSPSDISIFGISWLSG